jgi:hypothetical protein
MNWFARFAAITMLVGAATITSASATTYYIAASGSDSNNGTSTSSPWQHAPGMPNCAGTCASTTPQAGDRFIFRGGDTWHFKANTAPAVGGTWGWSWNGTSGSHIYIGVDKTWFTNSSWQRPILNLDNPPSKSFVSSCLFDESNFIGVDLHASSFIDFDNFDFTGRCNSNPPSFNQATYIYRGGTFVLIENSYFHGWTETNNPQPNGASSPNDGGFAIGGSTSNNISHNVQAYDVFDGSDSYCTGNNACMGWILYSDAYDVHNCIFRYVSNAINSPANTASIHDNLFEFIYESYDPSAHGGVIENYGNGLGSSPELIYNNVFRHINMGVTVNPNVGDGGLYLFNNVFYDVANGANCISVGGTGSSNPTSVHVTNNTLDGSTSVCGFRFTGASTGARGNFNGTAYYQNNHIIASGQTKVSSLVNIASGVSATIVDNGNNVFQTEAAANSQGYTSVSAYAPPSSGGASVGAGANLTPSCATYSSDLALCKGTTLAVAMGAGPIPIYPALSAAARPSSGSWDAGAYSSGSSANNAIPNPPSALLAVVQ